MLLEDKNVAAGELLSQVDRILRSEAFRSSEVLRKLLSYLAERTASGEADQLKEYTVAIEGLGKPQSYDPQQNSTARIQVGRLRQKLAEYYRTEGAGDSFIVDLPKGRFRLTCEPRAEAAPIFAPSGPLQPEPHAPAILLPEPQSGRFPWPLFLGGVLAGLLAAAMLYWLPMTHLRSTQAGTGIWTSEMNELWGPFLQSNRPLIVSIEDPLFVEVASNPGVYYRDRSMNTWSDVQSSPAVRQLSSIFGKPDGGSEIQPSRYYTAFGEAEAAFQLGSLLGSRGGQTVSMLRTSQLSWQQLADNNIVFVGVQNLFFEQLQGMPVALELNQNIDGIHNLHPRSGEPTIFKDEYSTAPLEQGTMYALVTHVTGPMGRGDIASFTSIRSAGYLGAVQYFSQPDSARLIVQRLKENNGGAMPRAWQVLLRIRFKDNVPTETTYVLGRALK